MQTIELLKYLSKKLQTGNTRSIHLNALPGRFATRLDITNLNLIDSFKFIKQELGLAESFLESLFTKPNFSFTISFDKINLNKIDDVQQKQLNILAKKLNAIYYENNDSYLEHGIKTFSFGYPLLIKRDKKDTSKVLKAPIFIWQLEIEKSIKSQNTWILRREDDFGVSINEVLISHINGDEDIKIEMLPSEVMEDCVMDKTELVDLCGKVLKQLNAIPEIEDIEAKLSECPNKEHIENLTDKVSWISWAGVFGLYRTQKQPIIKDIDILLSQFSNYKFDNLVIEKFQTSTVAGVSTDPSQEIIINSLKTNHKQIIQGPPGTGKSQSLTALITNAIENGVKCLVVCEKKTALEVIYNNLNKIGLGRLCLVIDDISKDRKKIIEIVRNVVNENVYQIPFRNQEYIDLITTFDMLKSDITKKHNNICKKIFGDYNWKDLIGKSLLCDKIQSKDILGKKISMVDLQYTYQEYIEVQRIIKTGFQLYSLLKYETQSLDILNRDIFKANYLQSFKFELEKNLNQQFKQAQYLNECINNYYNTFSSLANSKKKIYKLPKFLFNILPLSKTTRLIIKELDRQKFQIISDFSNLENTHINLDYFAFLFLNKELFSIDNIENYIAGITNYLNQITNINAELKHFKEYYDYTSFYFSLNINYQNIIAALIKSNSNNWEVAFESWYLNNVLMKYEKEIGNVHKDDRQIMELSVLNDQLKQLQKTKILNYWVKKQWYAIDNYKKGNLLSLYNFKKNKQYESKNSLRKIINTDFDLFTTFFPVLLINPVVCSSIIPLKEGIFDMVIFDEASQLRIEETYAALFRGKYKIISGDKHQMPPSNYFNSDIKLNYSEKDSQEDEEIETDDSIELADSESLLKYAEDSGFKYSYLDFHYRSRHPFLIDFSNVAFYGSRLVPIPAKHNYKPIRFIQVSGIYANSTNISEAKEVRRLLFSEIKPFKDGTYPSVGIATLNLYQRNLILDEIQQECSINPQSAKIYEQINKSGFFVKNLENIQGDEKDIIIISTTFGFNVENKFRQNFGPLNQDKGYRLLNVIITRAKYRVYVVTSIPQFYYSKYREVIETKGNIGKGIFYAYLSYAEAVEKDDNDSRKGILTTLNSNCTESIKLSTNDIVESPFNQVFYDYFSEKFDKNLITIQYKCGGFMIDFVIKSKKEKMIAIESDGAIYHNTEVAYSHDIYRQKQLESLGFAYYRVWSTNFWYNPIGEIEKLIHFIDSIDNNEGDLITKNGQKLIESEQLSELNY